MKTNRSMPGSTMIPVLAYHDVTVASEWLSRAFGFRERLRIGGHRIQMVFGDGAVVTTEGGRPGGSTPEFSIQYSLMVRVEDINAHKARVEKSGGRIVRDLTDYPYG